MRRDPGIPYPELTCPRCKGTVHLVSDEGLWADYACMCGTWTQYAVWGTERQSPKWEYVAKQADPDVD